MSYGSNMRAWARQAGTLADVAKKPKRQRIPGTGRFGKRSISDEKAALIKRDAARETLMTVALRYDVTPSLVKNIKDELSYREVKAAP